MQYLLLLGFLTREEHDPKEVVSGLVEVRLGKLLPKVAFPATSVAAAGVFDVRKLLRYFTLVVWRNFARSKAFEAWIERFLLLVVGLFQYSRLLFRLARSS